jgi:hypothetical protein
MKLFTVARLLDMKRTTAAGNDQHRGRQMECRQTRDHRRTSVHATMPVRDVIRLSSNIGAKSCRNDSPRAKSTRCCAFGFGGVYRHPVPCGIPWIGCHRLGARLETWRLGPANVRVGW